MMKILCMLAGAAMFFSTAAMAGDGESVAGSDCPSRLPWASELSEKISGTAMVIGIRLTRVAADGGDGWVVSTPYGPSVPERTKVTFEVKPPAESAAQGEVKPASAWNIRHKVAVSKVGDTIYLALPKDVDLSKGTLQPGRYTILFPEEADIFCRWVHLLPASQQLATAVGEAMKKKVTMHLELNSTNYQRPAMMAIISIPDPLDKGNNTAWAQLMITDPNCSRQNISSEGEEESDIKLWEYLPKFLNRTVCMRTCHLDDDEIRRLDKIISPVMTAVQQDIYQKQSQSAPVQVRLIPLMVGPCDAKDDPEANQRSPHLSVTAEFTNKSAEPVKIIVPQDGSEHGCLDPVYMFRVEVEGEKGPLPLLPRCGNFGGDYDASSFVEIAPGKSVLVQMAVLPFRIPDKGKITISMRYTVSPTTERAISQKPAEFAITQWPKDTFVGSSISMPITIDLSPWIPVVKKRADSVGQPEPGKSQLTLHLQSYSPIVSGELPGGQIRIVNSGPDIPVQLWKDAAIKMSCTKVDDDEKGKVMFSPMPCQWIYRPHETLCDGKDASTFISLPVPVEPGTYHVRVILSVPGRGATISNSVAIEVRENPWNQSGKYVFGKIDKPQKIKTPEIIEILETGDIQSISTSHAQGIYIILKNGWKYEGTYVHKQAGKYANIENCFDILNLVMHIKEERSKKENISWLVCCE